MLRKAMRDECWPVTFSIGLVTYYTPPERIDEIIRNSDSLMYLAKKGGKNTIESKIIN
jgi:PleD family two-component response regulator